MPQFARGFDGGADLRRVVRVVVVDGRALKHPEELHPAVSARESAQRGGHVGEVDADLERHGGRGGRVLNVVAAWLAQVDLAKPVEAAKDRERPRVLTPIGRVVAKSVRDLL